MPIYMNFEVERAPKNVIFCSNFFKKFPKTAFLTSFDFENFACDFVNIGSLKCSGSARRKIDMIDLKKQGRQNLDLPSRKT